MYLVTGGAGFIGSHLVAALVERGERVRVLDNFATGFRRRLTSVEGKIELIEGDICNPETCAAAMRGVQFVLHQAALPSVARSLTDPVASNDVNVGGTVNLLRAAHDARVQRFVYASSSSVYGDTPTLPKVETMPSNPQSPYAVSKLAGEWYCRVFAATLGVPTVSLRYFNVYGPNQDANSAYAAVIPRFITALHAGQSPTVYGDGEQSRDFTFIADCVSANLLACKAPDVSGEVFNIACGSQVTLNDLLARIQRLTGRPDIPPQHVAARVGDVRHSRADVRRAAEKLTFSPKFDIEAGLAQTVQWYRAQSAR
jgi:nucleoside-diphosphate-sugar epimerase